MHLNSQNYLILMVILEPTMRQYATCTYTYVVIFIHERCYKYRIE